ncbi:MAG: NAD(P)-dependent oxidoreductase [Dehalococcoidia bacterium]
MARRLADWDSIPGTPEIRFYHDRGPSFDTLVARLADVDILCTMRERTILTGDLLRALPALRLVAATRPDQRRTDFATANEQGVLVCTTGALAGLMTEFTWGMIIALARRIAEEDAAMRRGGWQTALGTALTGKTLGIIGFGRLGRRVAAVAPHFGMRAVAWGFLPPRPRRRRPGRRICRARNCCARPTSYRSTGSWRATRTERAFGARRPRAHEALGLPGEHLPRRGARRGCADRSAARPSHRRRRPGRVRARTAAR